MLRHICRAKAMQSTGKPEQRSLLSGMRPNDDDAGDSITSTAGEVEGFNISTEGV